MNPRTIGISLDWEACLPLAREAGFEGIDVPVDPHRSVSQIRDLLDQFKLKTGGAGLNFHMSDPEPKVSEALASLPEICRWARDIGQTRFFTWILPFSDHLAWKDNFRLHVERLGRAAEIMADHGCRLGLEFLGPKTLRSGRKFSFVHTMEGMLDLCEAVGPNTGLLLDAWHWYTSLGTVEELMNLTNQQVVYVHINDAPAGVALDQQQDLVRALPGETGVIDLPGFLNAVRVIGYDGPVVPEPFVKALAEMAPNQAAQQVASAMRSVWPQS